MVMLLPLVGAMMTGNGQRQRRRFDQVAAPRRAMMTCSSCGAAMRTPWPVAAPRRGDDDLMPDPHPSRVEVLLPLVGAMMTQDRNCHRRPDHYALLPLVGAMMTSLNIANPAIILMLLPLVGAMMTLTRSGPVMSAVAGCCPS